MGAATLLDNFLNNNDTDAKEAFMKKPLFGGSETYDLGNQYLNNIEIHKKDKESVIYTNTPENVTNTIKKLTAKENYPLLYKFLSKI